MRKRIGDLRRPGFPAVTNGCCWRRNAPFTITAANREVGASFSLPCSPGEGRLTLMSEVTGRDSNQRSD